MDFYYGFVRVFNYECFFGQRVAEKLFFLCISANELFPIAFATSIGNGNWSLKRIVVVTVMLTIYRVYQEKLDQYLNFNFLRYVQRLTF